MLTLSYVTLAGIVMISVLVGFGMGALMALGKIEQQKQFTELLREQIEYGQRQTGKDFFSTHTGVRNAQTPAGYLQKEAGKKDLAPMGTGVLEPKEGGGWKYVPADADHNTPADPPCTVAGGEQMDAGPFSGGAQEQAPGTGGGPSDKLPKD